MKHLDLFSGIGGFALAADRVFENVEHTFVEIDPFCQKVLVKHWPGSKIYGDIKDLKLSKEYDLVTGGFPCQGFSTAGKKRGFDDPRYLWPEMLRVIQECQPTWVIGENVAGIVNMALEQVCSDLENEGYEVIPLVIPACAVNAPHRRDRVWILAHSSSNGLHGTKEREGGTQGNDSDETRTHQLRQPQRGDTLWSEAPDWNQNWTEVAARICRVPYGLSTGLHRTSRIKALGNAIVPAVAVEIMKAIKYKK